MNISNSESSSACESGWTRYLDQVSDSTDPYRRGFVQVEQGAQYVNQEEEDEDLSMVSDASSAPPHLPYGDSVSEDRKKSKNKETAVKKKPSLCLDDTASSANYQFSQGHVAPSEKYNVLHLEEESVQKKHISFFKSSTKGKSGSLLGRKKQ